ncbi:hypothetical protein H4582DRAFT_2069002 [Lactarius indigo]|nr:hypothetical protein H4582DRAFT_2069002 [Lactarius indigo]
MLASKTKANLTLSRDSKSDRGFNHDILGRLLIPIEHIAEYDSDPLSGVKGYEVTAHDAPAFLYEDPDKYNPDNILSRFMRGYFLTRARFALSSQQTWSGKDEDFDYEEFAENLFKVFEENEQWAEQTIQWWNKELFSREEGARPTGLTWVNASNGFLAKARAQNVKHLADEAVAEMAAG